MYCAYCGRSNENGNRFCNYCGKPLTEQRPKINPFSPQPNAEHGKKPPAENKRKKLISTLVLCAAAFFIVDMVLLANVAAKNSFVQWESGVQGYLQLGETTFETYMSVDQTGGDIVVDNNGSQIDGLRIHVPQGAYDGPLDFEISSTQIKGQTYGDLIDPLTPLITINNSEIFANEPLAVTVPIQKADNELAMGFYYEEETGQLEAIPFLSQTNEEITLLTNHFSAIVVSKTDIHPGRIVGNVETNFKVGTDDIQTPNHGSIIAPNGHCAGQTSAMLYYYTKKDTPGFDGPLNGRFDNNDLPDTEFLWQDDSNLVRLCSVLQTESKIENATQYLNEFGYNDELTYYAFVYALQVTGHPQILGIYRYDEIKKKDVGHALLVCAINGDTLTIADPNFPGEYRTIELKRRAGSKPDFSPYYSGGNVKEALQGKAYDKFLFAGDFALVDENAFAKYWQQLISGEKVAADEFSDSSYAHLKKIDVAMSEEPNGQMVTAPLTDGLTLGAWETSTLGLNTEGLLLLRKDSMASPARMTVYVGDVLVGELQTEWMKVATLQPGNNDIGILYELKNIDGSYNYYDFIRYNIVYGEDSIPTPTPEPTPEYTPEPEPTQVPTATPAGVATQTWELVGTANYSESGEITPLDNYDQHSGTFIELPISTGELTIDGYTCTYTYLPGNGIFAGFIEIRNEYSEEPRVLCIGVDGRIYETLFSTYPTVDATLDVYEPIE